MKNVSNWINDTLKDKVITSDIVAGFGNRRRCAMSGYLWKRDGFSVVLVYSSGSHVMY